MNIDESSQQQCTGSSNMEQESTTDLRVDSDSFPKRKKDATEQPLFLRKAYAMINSCSPELGGWSKKGSSFIVLDADSFADNVIPTFYRHSNWASFVRQLNFYGFRKVKSEVHLSAENATWEFAHPCFLKGRPDLLSEIVRKVGPHGKRYVYC